MERDRITQKVIIEPSPRILQMLGHVNFQGWQCLGELIDNSIDAFITQEQLGVAAPMPREVRVSLPTPTELDSGRGVIVVQDNAQGMALEQIQNAVRAGYSGNDPIGKLGLFGMGFNVATARLGKVTEMLSHRKEDDEWVGIRIDVDEMIKARSWSAPVIRERLKPGDPQSGTKVRVTGLARQGVVRSMIYGRGKASLLRKISRIYHAAVGRYQVVILVNEQMLAPWQLCLWDESRSVPHPAWGQVPAVFPVDIPLPSLPYCTTCWEWGTGEERQCMICGRDMIVRERRIRGRVGIQRSFSIAFGGEAQRDYHYGFDLVRNGRVIEEFDKDLFYWVQPDDPNRRELEYPVDAAYLGGRIVGELEVDFVPLRSYHKDSFEKSDPSWLEVRRALRSEYPLQPILASKWMGGKRPDTILARLFDAYRKTSPAGRRFLITGHPPGTKDKAKSPMHESPLLSKWIEAFEGADPEYATDERWWEAVEWAELPQSEEEEGSKSEAGGGSIFAGRDDEGESQSESVPERESQRNRVVEFARDDSLSVEVDTSNLVKNAPSTIKVNAFRVFKGELENGRSVQVNPLGGGQLEFKWDPRHRDFAQALANPIESLVSELALQVIYLAQVSQRDYPASYVQREILKRAFPKHDVDIDAAAARAEELLKALRAFLSEHVPIRGPWDIALDPLDQAELVRYAARSGIRGDQVIDLVTSGQFLQYMPLRFLPKTAQVFPAVLMGDAGYFSWDYEGYTDEELRESMRESLYANLLDAVWLVDARNNIGASLSDLERIQLRKSLSALELLELKRNP